MSDISVLHLVTTPHSSHFQEQLQLLDERGVDQDVVASHQAGISLSLPTNVDLARTAESIIYYSTSGLAYYPKVLKNVIKQGEYDLIHATSGLVAPFALAQPKRPVVLSYWGTDVFGGYLNGHFKKICKLCATQADAVTVPSKRTEKELGYPSYVIPHGVDLSKFKPMDQNKCREELNWDSNKKHVLFPYDPHRKVKRFNVAQRAVQTANKSLNQEITLQVVTDEPYSKIPIYMNAADALLVTSSHESQPLTVKEAIACNLPVVSKNVGDVKQYLEDVSPSEVCDSDGELSSALLTVLSSSPRSNGREMKKDELKPEKMADKILSVYNDVI